MARGRINGKKIHVEGFTPNDPENEEIYRVVAQGRSVAGGSDGLTVESNMATVVHEKHAEVRFGTPCHCDLEGCAPELCGCVRVHTKNIKRDTVVAVQVPGYVNQYVIERQTPTLYYLKYCLYPGYDTGIEMEPFILAGTDIYGNVIPSEKYWVNPVNVGQIYIDLREDMDVPASATSQVLNYTWHPDVVVSTITRYDIEGDIRNVIFTAPGIVTVFFPQNYSRTSNRTYRIRIIGRDRFGSVVKSNYVTLTQGKAGKDGQFYILGDDINYDQTEAVFTIHYASGTTGIEIVDYSPTITGILSSAVTSPGVITVTALTEVNTETSMKELTISATGLTNNGTEVYAEGLIYQLPGVFLLILGKCTGNKTGSLVNETTADIPLGNILNENDRNYCSRLLRVSRSIHEYGLETGSTESEPTELYRTDENSQGYEHYTGEPVFYYTQNETFKYTSYGVTGIMASGDTAFAAAGGRATVNSVSKTVSLSFSKNMTGTQRTFTITLYGRRSDNSVISATYTFTQMKQDGNVFTLQSGTTFESTVELPYTVTSISLKIRCPADYKDIGLAATTTSLSSYTIHNARITKNADEEYTLNADLYSNNTPRSITYTVVVSAYTGDNRVKYSKTIGAGGSEHGELTIIHKPYTSVGDYILISPDTVSVRGSENSYLVHFTFTSGITNMWVDMCQVTDGDRGVVSCTSPDMGNGTLTISFPANPPEGRTIKLRLGGMNVSNEAVMSNEFTLTQGAVGNAQIIIWADSSKTQRVGELKVPFDGGVVNFYVEYISMTSGTPSYSPTVFDRVSNAGASVSAENRSRNSVTRTVVFSGTSVIDGSVKSVMLDIIQEGRPVGDWEFVIDSQNYYRSDYDSETFIVPWDAGNYDIIFKEFEGIDISTVRAVILDNESASASTSSTVSGWGIALPEAPKDAEQEKTIEVQTRIYLTGVSTRNSSTVTSNVLTFIQPETVIPPGPEPPGPTPDYASLQTGYEPYPQEMPASGGSITIGTRFKNVDPETIGFIPEAVEFLEIIPDFDDIIDDGDGFYMFYSTIIMGPNTAETDYQDDCSKYYSVTGTSTLDGSLVDDRERIWQLVWRNLRVSLTDGAGEIWDTEYINTNNLHLSIVSRSDYTIDITTDNGWLIFTWRGSHVEGGPTLIDVYGLDTEYNVGQYERSCVVYAENETASQRITLFQSSGVLFGCRLAMISQTPETVPASGGDVVINFAYEGFSHIYGLRYDESEVESASLSMTPGSGEGTITATIKRNYGRRSRDIAITVSGNNRPQAADISGELWVGQSG